MFVRILLYWLILFPAFTYAQLLPIGQWREHFPYREAIKVTPGDNGIYCATPYSLFSVTGPDLAFTRYSKVNGLSDAAIGTIGYHPASRSLVIAYRNSNLDILRNNTIINVPDILQRQTSGDKRIRDIYFSGDRALLSTGLGIIVLNLNKPEIEDTWVPAQNTVVYGITADNLFWYAATASGVKKAPIQGFNLADHRNWSDQSTGLPQSAVSATTIFSGQLLCRINDTLFNWNGTKWDQWYVSPLPLTGLSTSPNTLLLSQPGRVIRLSGTATIIGTFGNDPLINQPADALLTESTAWIADSRNGLIRVTDNIATSFSPNSPAGIITGDLLIHNGSLWAASGGVTDSWQPLANTAGIFRFNQEEWEHIPGTPALHDPVPLAAFQQRIYAGSFGGGLLTIGMDNQSAATLPLGDSLISGLATDLDGNLWVSAFGASGNLLVKKKDNSWQRFTIPLFHLSNAVSQIMIDDANQKWIVSPRGNGVFVFNHGTDLANTADDKYRLLQAGTGRGNLPSNDVFCLNKDKDGYIWIGTSRGIAVVQCPAEVFSAGGCEAYLPVIRQDNFAGYLFQNEKVNTIATDGANRKWIGTQNGAWLVSAGGEKIITHFNTGNSPLPSNIIHRIVVHPETGEVFFATAAGLLSYRGTATEGNKIQDNNVLVFPNPVPHNYEGTIAIKGLVQNAVVKITDITGKLVYQTRAQGGQAVWNGRDYTGYRPQSGVYLIFASDETGKEKIVTKLVFIR